MWHSQQPNATLIRRTKTWMLNYISVFWFIWGFSVARNAPVPIHTEKCNLGVYLSRKAAQFWEAIWELGVWYHHMLPEPKGRSSVVQRQCTPAKSVSKTNVPIDHRPMDVVLGSQTSMLAGSGSAGSLWKKKHELLRKHMVECSYDTWCSNLLQHIRSLPSKRCDEVFQLGAIAYCPGEKKLGLRTQELMVWCYVFRWESVEKRKTSLMITLSEFMDKPHKKEWCRNFITWYRI